MATGKLLALSVFCVSCEHPLSSSPAGLLLPEQVGTKRPQVASSLMTSVGLLCFQEAWGEPYPDLGSQGRGAVLTAPLGPVTTCLWASVSLTVKWEA